MISSTPIKTNTDIKNPITNVSNDESSTLHSMKCMEIDFLRKEKIDLWFQIQCLEKKVTKTEILYCSIRHDFETLMWGILRYSKEFNTFFQSLIFHFDKIFMAIEL